MVLLKSRGKVQAASFIISFFFARLEEVFPKPQQKHIRVTSRRETRSVPVTTFRSPSSEQQKPSGIGNPFSEYKVDLRGSYQIPPDISKSTGPDVFRKTVMTAGQSGVYPNISKVLLTVEDEQPHLMRSASVAKIDPLEANQTQISSKYFAQSNENSFYRQGNHYF